VAGSRYAQPDERVRGRGSTLSVTATSGTPKLIVHVVAAYPQAVERFRLVG